MLESAQHDEILSAEPVSQTSEHSNALAADAGMTLEFVTECREHLATIEKEMLVLERNARCSESLNAVFRGFHTIKGLAGFFEFNVIRGLAHEVETLLDLARSSQLLVSSEVVDVVLESTDVVRRELAGIERGLAGERTGLVSDDRELLRRIQLLARGGVAVVAGEAGAAENRESSFDVSVEVTNSKEMTASPDSAGIREQVDVPAVTNKGQESVVLERSKGESSTSSVRIDTSKLDQLMDAVGEMMIAQTMIRHHPELLSLRDAKLSRDMSQLARVAAEVQRITSCMRMIPVGQQMQKTARLVRDLSRRAGKQIVLETSGEDTEVDKTIAEELSDPLLHMVRNSIDHGIESPEQRIALGKDPVARIGIAVYHQSGQIVIEISDDGRGLNRDRIRAKAELNGLIRRDDVLSDHEIYQLIFEAGFSTAEAVTDISGRGVGMDVVRRHVQRLRGRIEIRSETGRGTTFLIKLPLTLAIIEGLVVLVGEQRYIVPVFAVKEILRPSSSMIGTVQEVNEMVLVRGRLQPVVRLHRQFGIASRSERLDDGMLIVAESEGRSFCLFVDDLIGKQEVVIKSLGPGFKSLSGIAGCAILGDGRVGLILDMDGIYQGRSA